MSALAALVDRLRGPIMLATDHSDRRDAADEIERLTLLVRQKHGELIQSGEYAELLEGEIRTWVRRYNQMGASSSRNFCKFDADEVVKSIKDSTALSKNTTTAGADSPYVQAPAKEDRIRPEPSASTPEQALSPSGGSVPRDPEPTHIAQSAPATIPPIGGITEFHSENLADYTVSVLGVFRPVPEGWKLVPMLPNEEMIAVARRPHALGTTNRGQIEGAYVAMVHAAPEPPAVPSQVNSDTARLDWLAQQQGNLFTPATSSSGLWAWFGNDARAFTALGLRALIDDAMRKDAVLVEGTDK